MPNVKRLQISLGKEKAIEIHRAAHRAEHLVYIAVANKKLRYKNGQSRIGYIGTTKRGAERIASSAARRSSTLFQEHGVKTLSFYIVTCTARQKIPAWRKLERALLLVFREKFGEIPVGNINGHGMKWTDELDYFTERRLRTVIDKYS